MKSERRHELQTNVLADRLGTGMQSAQSYAPAILGAIALVVLAGLGWGMYSSSAKKKEAEAWTEYYFNLAGGDADSYLDVADQFPSSAAADWARQTAGQQYLTKGLDALFVDKSEGESLIKQAIDQFERLESNRDAELRTKALLGLGQAHESLGEIDQAASYYEKVTKSTTQPRLISKATERLAFLTSDSGKEFYGWFTKLDPKPAAPIQLPDGLSLPPSAPGDLKFSLPEMPSSTGDGSANTETDSPGAPGATAEVDPADLPELGDSSASGSGLPPVPTTPIELPPADTSSSAGEEAPEKP